MRPTADDVRRGLPRAVGVGIRQLSEAEAHPPTPWYPFEAEALGALATERRRAFFGLGRTAARDALLELGILHAAIGRGPAGEPLWPPGIAGAISHTRDLAVAVVGRQTDYAGLGVDVEELVRGPSPRAARLVCRPTEMEWVNVEAGTERLTMLFSAKEAVFKALFPIERVWLGFADAELTWRADRGRFSARVLKSVGAGYPAGLVLDVNCLVADGLVLTTAFVLRVTRDGGEGAGRAMSG